MHTKLQVRELKEKGYMPLKSNMYIIITIVSLLSDNWSYIELAT
jgi:hypothetical protein